MFCVHCGHALEVKAKFCGNCGKETNINSDDNVSKNEPSNRINMNKVNAEPSYHPQTDSNGVDFTLLKQFVGEDKEHYYMNKWSKGDRSWNWAAFFLSFFWLGYRKMYKPIFIAIILFLIFDFVILFLPIDETYANSGIGIAIGMTMGFWGNYFYRNHAIKKIASIQRQYGHNPELIQHEIKLQGGTSWLGAFGAVGLFFVYILLTFLMLTSVPDFTHYSKVVSSTPEIQEFDEEEVKDEISYLLKKNTKALEDEDLDAYMSMIDEENSVIYAQTEEMLEALFEEYDLSYEISDTEFISITEDRVRVQVTQLTTKVSGAEYRDNESVLLHTLINRDGKWKFSKSDAKSVNYFDENVAEEDSILSSLSSAIMIQAPDMFDFNVSENVDVNNDGIPEIVSLQGGPMVDDEFLNEQVEITVQFESDSFRTSVDVMAEDSPTLYLYDINEDGWMELFYETGYRISLVEVYQFGEEGLQYYSTLEGNVEEFHPFEVVTSEDIYSFEQLDYADPYEEARYIFEQSCVACHGMDLTGGVGPALNSVGATLSQRDIEDIILYGTGLMPGGSVTDDEARKIAEWLSTLK